MPRTPLTCEHVRTGGSLKSSCNGIKSGKPSSLADRELIIGFSSTGTIPGKWVILEVWDGQLQKVYNCLNSNDHLYWLIPHHLIHLNQ